MKAILPEPRKKRLKRKRRFVKLLNWFLEYAL